MAPYTSHTPETHNHLAWLRQCVEGIASPFVASGEVHLPRGVTLRFADGAEVALHAGDRGAPPSLIARCAPAPFVVKGFDPAASGVLETIREDLCPHDPNPLRAELYGVNVYQRGGHFVAHKDTPRGDDMLGTLVLCVSRQFGGGDLVFRRGRSEQCVAFGAPMMYGSPQQPMWTAFFGDVDHTPSEIRRMLADGTLERCSYGWYRFARPPKRSP